MSTTFALRYRKSRFYQRIITAQHRGCVPDSVLIKCLHRTGAGVFRWSRTIGGDEFVFGQLLDVRANITGGNQARASDVPGAVGFFIADID